MRRPRRRCVAAVLLALAGVGGSFMSGATIWAVIGPVAVLVGQRVAATGRR